MVNEDFASQFYNIEGDLVGERKKNFRKLLASKPALSDEELQNVRPRTYLESLLYIDTLIHFKKTTHMLEIVQEGNEVFISKILKQTWFFEEIFKDISAKELVNDFLPCTSFTTRKKILNRLASIFDESQMDNVYECVNERYGFHIAKNILHTCSSDKINEVLTIHEVCLQPNQVKVIFDKNPDLFLIYLEYYEQLKGKTYFNKYVYKHIAKKNIKLWLYLNETGKIQSHTLGRRISKKVVDLVKPDVMKNVTKYTAFLRKDAIVRKLHGNFKDVYQNLFPTSKTNLKRDNLCNILLGYYPKKGQWNLLSQTFAKVYDQSILDNLLYLYAPFLNLFPSRNVTIKWAEVHYKTKHDNSFLKYFEPKKAYPLIKDKINVTSDINDRTNLVVLLLRNCAENGDLKSLEVVLNYICYRHRNEETAFRYRIFDTIKTLFRLQDLNETHWKHINEQVCLLKYTGLFNYSDHLIFLHRYLEYLILNGKSVSDELKEYFDEVIISFDFPFRVDLKNPQIEKEILIQIIHLFQDNVAKDDIKYSYHQARLIIDILQFNKKYPEYFVDIREFSDITSYIYSIFKPRSWEIHVERSVIRDVLLYNWKFPEKAIKVENAKIMELFNSIADDFWLGDVLYEMVNKRNRSEFENEVFKFFWDKLFYEQHKHYSIIYWCFYNEPRSLLPHLNVILEVVSSEWCLKIISWYFSNEPRCLVPYFDIILEKNLSRDGIYFKAADVKLMSHFNFDARLIEVYLKKLNLNCSLSEPILKGGQIPTVFSHRDGEDYFVKKKVIQVLSIVMSTDDFVRTVAAHFLPVNEKVDLLDADAMEMYKLQCDVAKHLRFLGEPVKVLATVIKFSIGDYLQSALPALYSIFYRSPEKSLSSYIDVLSKRAVSARKHSIFLSCELLDYDYTVRLLKTANRNNVSSEKHLFSATLKYFTKNPSEDMLDLVISNLSSIDENDDETFNSLVDIVIPKKYKTTYLEKCWTFFENMRDREVRVTDYLDSILYHLCSKHVLEELSREFCIQFIINYFKSNQHHSLYQTNEFVIKFLRYRLAEQEKNFQFFFEIISAFKSENMNDDIESVFHDFCKLAADNLICDRTDVDGIRFLKLFEQGWMKLFQPTEKFDEYVTLTLLTTKYVSPDPFLENYARNVVRFFEKLLLEYGPLIFYKCRDHLQKSLTLAREERHLFLYHVLKIGKSSFYCMLVLELLVGKSEEIEPIYEKILEILKSIDDPIVVLYYNSHMKSLDEKQPK